ncbi:MAG: hypothetical protein PF638_11165 [Candidatus Delongbacteria bacterium]|jgi:hypothetical protein|nr:hypothetical protein [Candidatus Delongbacteria bacterium]
MRSRYVKKCKCDTKPIVTTKTCINLKGVLDIDLSVACPECERLYKEVAPKMTRMENPQVSIEWPRMPEEIDIPKTFTDKINPEKLPEIEVDNGPGSTDSKIIKSKEVTGKKKEPSGSAKEEKNKTPKTDKETIRDEAGTPDQIEVTPTPERKRSKDKGDVFERLTEDALESDGVPLPDLF